MNASNDATDHPSPAPPRAAGASRELPSRVLVTGAGGAIGSAVAAALTDAGVDVVALDRRFVHDPGPRAHRVEGDVTDERDVAAAIAGCEAVAHLAAYPSPAAASAREVFRVNTQGAFTVLSLAGELGIRRAVIASSINANGLTFHPQHPLPRSFPLTIDEPARIADWYSLSKADDERTAAMCAERFGTSIVCLRLPHTADGAVLDQIAERNRQRPHEAVQEGWAYLHTTDAAAAFVAALAATVPAGPVGARSVAVLIAADEALIPWATDAALEHFAPGVPLTIPLPGRTRAIDTRPARALLGWQPRHAYYGAETTLQAVPED